MWDLRHVGPMTCGTNDTWDYRADPNETMKIHCKRLQVGYMLGTCIGYVVHFTVGIDTNFIFYSAATLECLTT